MSNKLVKAWKDEEYRLSLSEAERALLPENPAGSFELTDVELATVAGGGRRRGGSSSSVSCFFTANVCFGSYICVGTNCGRTIIVNSRVSL
jgi:mersacidin/lichenicidin family type 2 lantibiotic